VVPQSRAGDKRLAIALSWPHDAGSDGVLGQSRVSAETLVYPLGGYSGVSAETRNHIPQIPCRDSSP
jgi:hypothetical protein